MQSLLHIGMPKCMSTSIQAWLREAEDAYFMGIGPSKHMKTEVLEAFQRQILRTPTQFYDSQSVGKTFARERAAAAQRGSKLFAFSDESIPFPLGYARADVSYVERLLRLREVMPDGTHVLMIVRRPEDYLKSTYKYRTVMNGMNFTFDEYVRRLILLGDTYSLGTIKFYHYAEAARRIFGNCRVLAMEDIEDDPDCLLSWLREMGADGADALPRENKGLPGETIENFRHLYGALGISMSDDDFNVMTPAERRICKETRPFLDSTLATVLAKEQILGNLREFAQQLPLHRDPMTFHMADQTRKFLADYVAQSNELLQREFGVATDDYNYGLF
jgi:hypothetical protein